jgi:hypothetical protein
MSRQGTFAFGKKFTIRDRKLTLRQNQSPEKDKTPLGKTAKASVDDLKEETFSENESSSKAKNKSRQDSKIMNEEELVIKPSGENEEPEIRF